MGKFEMAEFEQESSNALFETLEEWNDILEADHSVEIKRHISELRGPRP